MLTLSDLRAAAVRRDGAVLDAPGLLDALRRWPQHGGQLLLRTQADRPELVAVVQAALARRGWTGDDVLVAQLEGTLLPLAQVDLDQLAEVLDGTDDGDLDLATGETWQRFEDDLEVDEEDARIRVPGRGGREAWRDREAFAEALDDRRGQRLLDALHRRGPFRAFADVLDSSPDLVSAFLAHRDERQVGRARAWLLHEGLLDPQDRE